ncbi:MAG TPA: hypothetical protein VNZ26_18460, partial [Vicinamibacterales bacterium]|nr:hypothetical protein [Vicinamibacterales bacterium]
MKVSLLATAAALAAVVAGCGKKGPPLPPLIKLPSAPAELTAERRGDTVDFQFNVPNTNTDNSHPANIERVDVYALNGAASLKDAEFLKLATRVASVPVKAPRNPDETADPDDPDTVVDAPEGNGLDQGAAAHLSEQLTADSLKSVDASKTSGKQTARARQDDGARPLLGPPSPLPSRTYVAVGQSTRGKKGALSRRVAVPLIQPPVAPGAPTFKYDETSVTVRWSPINPPATVQSATSGDVLPSTPIGVALPSIAYHVYDSSPASETAVPAASDGQTTS